MKSEENLVTNYSFFSTLIVSIFKFDKYYEIMQQKTRKMVVFLFELVVLISLVITGIIVLKLNNTYEYAYNFAKDNLPDFTITKEGFHMDIEEPLIYRNTEHFNTVAIFDNGEDNKQYLEEAEGSGAVYMVFTKNSLVLKVPGTVTTEYRFSEMFTEKTESETSEAETSENSTEVVSEDLTERTMTKESILKMFGEDTVRSTIGKLALYVFLLLFLSLSVISLINIVTLALLGYVFAKIIKMPFKFRNVFNMAIAATALPTVLLCAYMVINILTGFVISKFDVLYAVISYIYLGAAILILRANMNKVNTEKEKKVAAETGSSNIEVTIEDSGDNTEDEEDSEDDTEDNSEEESDEDIE